MAETPAREPRVPARPGPRAFAVGAVALAAIIAVGLAWPAAEQGRGGPPLVVTGWAPYWQPDASLASFTANADLFADVSVVAYSATGVTTITRYPALTDEIVATFRDGADAASVPLIATIFDDSPAGTMAAILADPTARAEHVETIRQLVDAGGFDGVDLDYESFAFDDGRETWTTTRPNWISFLGELDLALRLTDPALQLIVSVPPVYDAERTDDSGYWVYDPAAMAPLVDRIRVMAYDYSTPGSAPGPIAPIEWVRGLVSAMTDLVPPDKLDLGIPVYGYDWVIGVTGVCPADQLPDNEVISLARATRLVAERGLTPVWDTASAEAVVDYVDTLTGTDSAGTAVTCTVSRTVRYLDGRAVQVRAGVANRADLHGVALWALGYDDDTAWQAIRSARAGNDVVPSSAP